ncbi:MAG: hypothetical protein ACWA5P_04330 [bacterium]
MNFKQRKWHGLIWIIIILVVPTIMYLSIKDISYNDNGIKNQEITASSESNLPFKENDLIKVIVRDDSIDIIIKRPLKNASTLMYSMDSDGKKRLLGQIGEANFYNFKTNNTPKVIVLFDTIKNIEITKLIL